MPQSIFDTAAQPLLSKVHSASSTLEDEGITIQLVGVPRVTGPGGIDLTPRGMRTRALLGLIALSPNMTASRRWLEAVLWPESDSERASASLRQALSGIRRSFAAQKTLLGSDRFDISLDRDCVKVDVLDTPDIALGKVQAGRDFLEGVDVPSEVFEDWLRQERSTFALQAEGVVPLAVPKSAFVAMPAVQANARPLLVAEISTSSNSVEMFVAECIIGQVGQTANELIRTDFRVHQGRSEPVVQSPSSACSIRVQQIENRSFVVARLLDRMNGELLWRRVAEFETADHESVVDAAASLATEIAEVFATRDLNASEIQVANAMAVSSIDDVFSFDPVRLNEAQEKLSTSNSMDPHAPRPALIALAKTFAAIENPNFDRKDLKDAVSPFIEESKQLDARNPVAMAFLADVVEHVFEDPATAMSLAKRAISLNPGFGYAYAGLSAKQLLDGQVSGSLMSAKKAHAQLRNTSLEVLSLMRLCVASMNAGLLQAAEDAAQRASDLAPFSCPPLRHLYALKLAVGDRSGARSVLRRLNTLEADFSMKRLREDPGYPSPSLRRVGFDKLFDVDL